MKETDAAYIAGLFDADGCATYKEYWCADNRYKDKNGKSKKYLTWNINFRNKYDTSIYY